MTKKCGIKVSITDEVQDILDAMISGWYEGTKLKRGYSPWTTSEEEHRDNEVIEWCYRTFNSKVYRVFNGGIWFNNESDAILCRLRWA
jgi:hypothetical protein